MITCTKCGATHPDGSKFCDECGEDLVIRCSVCGATARPQSKFCPQCRSRLDGDSKETNSFRDNVIDGNVDISTHTNIITNNYGASFSDMEDALCSECGEIIPARLKIYNKCNDCGRYFCNKHLVNQICYSCELERHLSSFAFEKRANNKYGIIRLKNPNEISVDIPSFVESIEDGAFEGSHLIRVAFHEGLIKIGNRAFANCKDLGDVSFPASLRIIGEEAFSGCVNFNAKIGSDIRVGMNAFNGTKHDAIKREEMRKAEEARRQEEMRKAEEARRIREAEERRKAEEAQRIREAEEKRKAEEARRIREAEERRKAEEARRIREAEERRKAEEARRIREAEEKRKAEWAEFTRVFYYEKASIPNTYKIKRFKAYLELHNLYIPEYVSEFAEDFERDTARNIYLSDLVSITVSPDNKYYRSESNCLIEIATNKLILGCKNSIIPDSVRSIGNFAFNECIGLSSIVIPNGVTSIGYGAFNKCSRLSSIVMPNSVNSIGEGAFYGCTSLKNITIPIGVKEIKESTFAQCDNFQSIIIPDGVTSIETYAFYGCDNLQNITIPDSVTSIGQCVFDNCDKLQYNEYNKMLFLGSKTNPFLVLIKVNSKDIDSREKLTNVTIPDGVKTIGPYAFWGCKSLKSITIPDSVEIIDKSAFADCTNLKTAIIPHSLKRMGESVFACCRKLKQIIFTGTYDQYKKISKAYWFLSGSKVSKVICSDGKVKYK